MMRFGWICVLVVLAMPVALAAQEPPSRAQRQMLQRQIGDRFMETVASQLRLDADARAKLEQHLRESGEQRRDLAERSQMLRLQMVRAARDTTTSDAELRKFLSEASALKEREDALWKSDQAALSRILTPRQHVQFVFLWLRFNDQIRSMASRRQPRP